MKRTVFITVMLAMVLSASAQQRSVILPGNAKIDVEKLNKQIPLNMDVSKHESCGTLLLPVRATVS